MFGKTLLPNTILYASFLLSIKYQPICLLFLNVQHEKICAVTKAQFEYLGINICQFPQVFKLNSFYPREMHDMFDTGDNIPHNKSASFVDL